jgi:hypothetical protein
MMVAILKESIGWRFREILYLTFIPLGLASLRLGLVGLFFFG